MSQMIDLETAKTMLGCDDATLQNLIDGGSVRAQREDGRLMVSLEDIKAQSGEKVSSSDSILVLDSDDQLSIDLGSVDDASQTMALGGAQTQELESASGTDSLSFGDELEVVSVEERSHHDSLVADGDGVATANIDDAANTQQLNFTDSNTAVMTDVDETVVGTGTATSDYQTVDEQGSEGPNAGAASARMASGRRNVRGSGRGMTPVEERKIPIWVVGIVFVLTVINLGIILPTWTVALWPREGVVYAQTGEKKFGADDGLWSNMASMMAGFSVEPDPEQFKKSHPGEVHMPIDKSTWDGQKGASFRSDEYLGPNYKGKPMAGALRAQSYLISSIETRTVDGKEVEIVNRASAVVKSPDGSIYKHVYEVEPDNKDAEGQDAGRYQIKSSKYQAGTKEGNAQ